MSRQEGFTLIEILIVSTILAVIAAIGVPNYQHALRTARITKAMQDLRTISMAIDQYLATEGELPLTLYEIDYGGRLDPWGVPYCYLNYSTGTGDGMKWAIDAGLVDPAAVPAAAPPPAPMNPGRGNGNPGRGNGNNGAGNGNGNGNWNGNWNGNANGMGIAIGKNGQSPGIDKVLSKIARRVRGRSMQQLLRRLQADPGAVVVDVPVAETRRRDRYMFPLNTDYDLFSLGPNGRTAASLSQKLSLDDVIRANDGAFFGIASKY
ncbi:MAG: hypothetical protein Fur0037_07480 [Planctomycetota bacterium]